jgi:hypothetical protein
MRTESDILVLSRRYSSCCYRRIHALVERQDHRCARRTVQRLPRQEPLRVTGQSRWSNSPPRPDALIRSEGLNDVWCLDLAVDVTTAGKTIKLLTIIHESRRAAITASISFPARDSGPRRGSGRCRRQSDCTGLRETCGATTGVSSWPVRCRNGRRRLAFGSASWNRTANSRIARTRALTAAAGTNALAGS